MNENIVDFKNIIDVLDHGIIQYDENGSIIFFNKAAEEIIGLTFNHKLDLFSMSNEWQAIHEDGSVFSENEYPSSMAMQTGKEQRNVIMGIKKANGSQAWILINSKPLFKRGTQIITGCISSLTDISHSRLIENNLKTQEKIYHQIIDKAEQGFIRVDEKGQIFEMNSSFCKLVGYRAEEIYGKQIIDFLDNPNRQLFYEQSRVSTDLYNGEYQLSIKHKNGQDVPVLLLISSIVDVNKKVVGKFAFCQDVSKYIHVLDEHSKLKTAIDQSPSTIVITDVNGFIEYVNPQFQVETGYSFEEVKGLNPSVLKSDYHNKDFYKNLWDTLISGKVWKGEFRNKRKDGVEYWENAVIAPVYNFFGEIKNFVAIKEDITEKKRVEDELIQSELKFRTLFENASLIVCLHQSNGQIISANKMMASLTGYSIAELQGMNINDLDKTYIERKEVGLIWGEQSAKKSISFESEYKRKNDSVFPIEVELTPVNINKEELILEFATDITARKQNERQILKLNSQLKEAQLIAKIGNWTNVFKTKSIEWSDAIFEIFAYEPNEDTPQNIFSKHIYNNDRRMFWSHVVNIQKSDSNIIEPIEFRIIDKNGILKYCRANGKFNLNERNIKIEAFGTLQDITTLKEIEVELKKNIQTKDKFFSIISHDLRSPFSTLLGMSELLVEDANDRFYDNIYLYASQIKSTAKSTFELLNNLLSWARVQTNRIVYTPQLVNVYDMQKVVVKQLEEYAKNKKIQIIVSCNDDIQINIDENMIQTVIRNLLSNAIKFTPPGGKIKLIVNENKNDTLFQVSDNGVGMSREAIDKLFQPEKMSSSKGTNNEPGTGIGLLLCKDFIDLHGGKIWVESKMRNINTGENGYTSFYFSIPYNLS